MYQVLNRATDKVRYDINRRIQAVLPDDEANFGMAIDAAFDMFSKFMCPKTQGNIVSSLRGVSSKRSLSIGDKTKSVFI